MENTICDSLDKQIKFKLFKFHKILVKNVTYRV